MAEEALVLKFLVVAVVVAVPDEVEVEIAESAVADGVAHNHAEVAAAVAAVEAVAGGDTEVVAAVEVVDNSIAVADVVTEIAAALAVQNLTAYKTHPGNATVATAVD